MKQLNIETVGGRIREVRNDRKMTMKDFASALEITGSYLGLVERGTRNPSPELLRRISRTMNVSYDWLVSGGIILSKSNKSNVNSDDSRETLSPARAVNPQLFLSTVLMRAPSITREMLPVILTTTQETIDKILAGEPVEFDPRWENAFSLLAQNMELVSLRQELRRLDTFLRDEETSARRLFVQRTLLPLLKKEAAQDYGEVEIDTVDLEQGSFTSDETLDLLFTQIQLRNKDNPSLVWYLNYYPYIDSADDATVETLYDYAQSLSESRRSKVSIVLQSLDAYNEFNRYFDDLKGKNEALAAAGLVCMKLPDISVIFFDEESRELDKCVLSTDEE